MSDPVERVVQLQQTNPHKSYFDVEKMVEQEMGRPFTDAERRSAQDAWMRS